MIYFISDTHFQHENIIKYCGRPFSCAADMNEQEIRNWNSVVDHDDDVYVTGDFILGNPANVKSILYQLHGKIHLIRGNHDTRSKIEIYEQCPGKIVEIVDICYLRYKGLFLILCHFPIDNPDFAKMVADHNSEVVTVHGHIHEVAPFHTSGTNVFNISADAINFTPVSIDTIWETIRAEYIEKGVWKGE